MRPASRETDSSRARARSCDDLTELFDAATPLARRGNPEQDCFTRFVYDAPAELRLTYPFESLGGSLKGLRLNQTTMAAVAEAPHLEFACLADVLSECRPWFLHFQAGHKDDVPLITRHYPEGGFGTAPFAQWWVTRHDVPTRRVHYQKQRLPCYATPVVSLPVKRQKYRFEGSVVACEGPDLPRFPEYSADEAKGHYRQAVATLQQRHANMQRGLVDAPLVGLEDEWGWRIRWAAAAGGTGWGAAADAMAGEISELVAELEARLQQLETAG